MAGTVLIEKKEMDPTTLTVNVLSIGAGIYVMIRLGAIAMEVMAKSGMQDDASVPVGADREQRNVEREQQQPGLSIPCLGRRRAILL
jgi:hypothetical protein